MRRIAKTLAVAAFGLGLVAVAVSQSDKKPVNWNGLPEPYATPSASNRPQVIERPDGAKLSLPQGFDIQEFATSPDFDVPRYMMLLPNNHILLSDSGNAQDKNGVVFHLSPDGKQVSKIVEGLDRPFGLEMDAKFLYVAERTSVKRYPFDAKSVKATGPGVELYSMKDYTGGHWTRSLRFNADKSKLYFTSARAPTSTPGNPRRAPRCTA